jgi:hypothetical protein
LPDYVCALVAVRSGDADKAIALARESLTDIRELQDKFAFVSANDYGSNHSRMNGAVIGKRSRRLKRDGELSAGRNTA